MANGFTGKILRINLTAKAIATIDTAKYEEFGGRFGTMLKLAGWDGIVLEGNF